jgi:ABC-type multidrug transport system ATPase subunit
MIVMQSIKNVSRNGRTVMVTIHQPSIDIFESFDALVLLQRGGKVSCFLNTDKSCQCLPIHLPKEPQLGRAIH